MNSRGGFTLLRTLRMSRKLDLEVKEEALGGFTLLLEDTRPSSEIRIKR